MPASMSSTLYTGNWTDGLDALNDSALQHQGNSLRTFFLTTMVIRGVQGALALLGNTLTIVAITRFRRLRTTSNAFIANLAAADILSAFTAVFFILLNLDISRSTWVGACHILSVLKTLSDSANLKCIVLIGIDRFVYINYPMRYYRIFSPWRVVIAITICWLIALAMYMVRVPYLVDMTNVHLCVVWHLIPRRVTIINCMFVWAQIVAMVAFYCFIFRLARQKARTGFQGSKTDGDRLITRQGLRVFKMAFTVLGVFTVLTVPGLVVVMLTAFGVTQPHEFPRVKLVVSLMWYGNSFVNPAVYAWQCRDFRRAFGTLLRLEKTPMAYDGSHTSAPPTML